jgi:hypothetical protein
VVAGVKHIIFWDGTSAVAALLNFLRRHPIGNRVPRKQ